VFDSPREGFGRFAVGKSNLAEDTAKQLHRHAYSYSFYLFNPGKTMLFPDSSQPVKSGQLRFDEHPNLLAAIEKDLKE
jgi:hypothetical protein